MSQIRKPKASITQASVVTQASCQRTLDELESYLSAPCDPVQIAIIPADTLQVAGEMVIYSLIDLFDMPPETWADLKPVDIGLVLVQESLLSNHMDFIECSDYDSLALFMLGRKYQVFDELVIDKIDHMNILPEQNKELRINLTDNDIIEYRYRFIADKLLSRAQSILSTCTENMFKNIPLVNALLTNNVLKAEILGGQCVVSSLGDADALQYKRLARNIAVWNNQSDEPGEDTLTVIKENIGDSGVDHFAALVRGFSKSPSKRRRR